MTDTKNKITMLKQYMAMPVSEELNAAGQPLARDTLVINENCTAPMCEWRC